jgi:hypothetical protein
MSNNNQRTTILDSIMPPKITSLKN